MTESSLKPSLSDPIRIASMKVKNRLYSAPMVSLYATEDGNVTPRLVDIYRQRAKGGWGLVCVEATSVRYDGRLFTRMLGAYKDQQIAGLNELAEAIRDGGARSCIQIMHGGRQANPRFNGGVHPMAPSSTAAWPPGSEPPRELTLKECDELADAFASAAGRAKEAGFDSVQLHAAHGFLLQQFLSPHTNHRQDRYGDRLAYVTEVIRKVKAVVGEDFPLGLRVSADEFIGDQGITIDDFTKNLAPGLERAGIHWLDVSAGAFETLVHWVPPLYFKKAYLVDLAKQVKSVVSIPVSGIGRINDPKLAAKLVQDGEVDIVAFGRQALADHDFARKALEGREDEIRRCIACDLGCTERLLAQVGLQCAMNFEFGQEPADRRLDRTAQPKRIMVVGGGIAGMEAARVLTLRGHQVTLYEKEEKLGGVLRLAVAVPHLSTSELWRIVDALQTELDALGVKVHLSQEVTKDTVDAANPDVVVLATGSRPDLPSVPGIDGPNVVTADAYLNCSAKPGARVVVLGGDYGAEIALSLARSGKEVTLVSSSASVANPPYNYLGRMLVMQGYLTEAKVKIHTEATVKAISGSGATIVGRDGQEMSLAADTVVIATGRVGETTLAEALSGKGRPVYTIGDCVEPKNILQTMRQAGVFARSVP
ncbi:MAG: FAD-dependent oxidoreductase [Polyangiaceae bacterium]|nr:FAD-dependent oxidoreductase [Polyangiaceae bacterium]